MPKSKLGTGKNWRAVWNISTLIGRKLSFKGVTTHPRAGKHGVLECPPASSSSDSNEAFSPLLASPTTNHHTSYRHTQVSPCSTVCIHLLYSGKWKGEEDNSHQVKSLYLCMMPLTCIEGV